MEDNNFSFILENCNESKMFRNAYLESMTLRDAADSVFLNMITLYLLSKEFETAGFAQDYAKKTVMFGNFQMARVGGTDLYQGIHIVLNPHDKTALKLNAEKQNAILASKMYPQQKMFKDFLRGIISDMSSITAIRLMYRIESQLGINISNYKSLRRLVTDWDKISTYQKQLCITRLLQYYRVRGRRSELFPVLSTLAQNKGWELTDAGNAELRDVGAGAIVGSSSGNGFLSSLAAVAAGALAGHLAQRALSGPVHNKK